MPSRHFPTHNQVFKVQNVPYFSANVPFTSHLPAIYLPFTPKSGVSKCDPIFSKTTQNAL
jgi:hypothetical protein